MVGYSISWLDTLVPTELYYPLQLQSIELFFISFVEFRMRCVAFTLIRELATETSSACQFKLAPNARIAVGKLHLGWS